MNDTDFSLRILNTMKHLKTSLVNNRPRVAVKALVFATAAAALVGCKEVKQAEPEVTLATDAEKLSYTIGVSMGKNLKAAEITVDETHFMAGFNDVVNDAEIRVSDEEGRQLLMAFKEEQYQKQVAKVKALAEENAAASTAFIAENGQKEGVVTLDSGLQYKVVTEGDGKKPAASDTVTVHYEGRLPDGTVFDSSIQRDQPATFAVTGVIPGWVEALQLMTVGSKWQLFIPSELAYGENG
ncbi:FKBP-type peptidyl-prolyl cis-trans isomerase, partial [bacterium]|nr:FKBP-type peptidyl-prolyl cis-trans isomerase [bacterium]